ncbi:MAG: methyltransferase domain-containing protein [Betaproteobacteria bacterium]
MPPPTATARPLASMLARFRLWRARRNQFGNRFGNHYDVETDDKGPATNVSLHDIKFRCNLCGSHNSAVLARLSREAPSCRGCGSNMRFRAMAHLVVREVLGRDQSMPDVMRSREIKGLGLSDVASYAVPLADKFDYENTWYHMAPQLDIANVPPERFGRYDFVVASDVFEHVAPPVSRAFANARKLLKPSGKFIFTVPFSLAADTVEHFPDLYDWSVHERNGMWQLDNITVNGVRQTFDDLIFHGGPGTTLEMRLFSRAALEREFARAGFARVRVADESYLPFGIHWPEQFSVPMVAYAS